MKTNNKPGQSKLSRFAEKEIFGLYKKVFLWQLNGVFFLKYFVTQQSCTVNFSFSMRSFNWNE